MLKFFAALLLLFILPVQAQAFDTIYLNVEKNEVIKEEKNLISIKPVDFQKIKKLDFDKAVIVYNVKAPEGHYRILFENTEIPLDELLTKKGIIKLVPAAISTYVCMNTLDLYGGHKDKLIHHTLNYVVTKVSDKPIKTASTVSILKEIGFDMVLGMGTPDIGDVAANFAGAVQANLVKNTESSKN